MVTKFSTNRAHRCRAALLTEAVVALGILATALLPLAFSFYHEGKLARAYFHKAVVMELIDGEMEVLAAGEWRALPPGRQNYTLRGTAATNLPPGECVLTLEANKARLEWIPKQRGTGGGFAREAVLK